MTGSGIASLIKQSVDIVEEIGRAVQLRRSGNRHLGLCPFHQEKTPSFQVDAENQLYYCFGCGSGGDVLNFVMKHRNLAFAEAVNYLADRYNIALPQKDQARDELFEANREERKRILEALECAADYFYGQLHMSAEGRAARDYIAARGLPEEVVQAQKLGFAPAGRDRLLGRLKKSGIEPALGVKAGLLGQSSNDPSKFFDRFRNRLIFPIKDERDKIVAFGGRILPPGDGEAKYLNSPETPVYHKGKMLYQYSTARQACSKVRQVLLVEGYMDLLAFHAKGFYRVAATLGTALTAQQVRLLGRMSDEVVLAYDGDDAGEKAMLRALPLFLAEELSVSCLRFPEGLDPDDFLKKFGLSELEGLIEKRQELGAYSIRKAVFSWDGSSAGKMGIFSQLQGVFQSVRQPLLRAEYLRIISERFSVTEKVAEEQLLHEKQAKVEPRRVHAGSASVSRRQPQIDSLDEKVLRLMIKHPDLVQCVRDSDVLGCFEEARLAAMAELLCRAGFCDVQEHNASTLYDLLRESDLHELYTRYLMEPYELEAPEIQLRDWLEAMSKRTVKKTNEELGRCLREAERTGDRDRVASLLVEIRNLRTKTNT